MGAHKTNYSVHTRKMNGTAFELSIERKPKHSINLIKFKNKSIKLAKTINDAFT